MHDDGRNPSLDRRRFIAGGSGAAAVALSGCQTFSTANRGPADLAAHVPRTGYLFALGVASGEPLPDSVVIWTRLAPAPFNAGAVPPHPRPVQWGLAQ